MTEPLRQEVMRFKRYCKKYGCDKEAGVNLSSLCDEHDQEDWERIIQSLKVRGYFK